MKTRTTEEDRKNSELSIQMLLPPRSRSTQFVLDLIQDFNEQARLLDSLRRISIASANQATIRFRYRNHRGEESIRRVRVWTGTPEFSATPWHSEQWIFEGNDLDKQQSRTFAVPDILEWLEDE